MISSIAAGVLIIPRQDIVLCRQHRGLQKRIEKEGEHLGLKCQVKYWEDAWEVEEIFDTF